MTPAWHDIFTHALKERPGLIKVGSIAAHNKSKCTGLGAGCTTRHRRIYHAQTLFTCGLADLDGGLRRNGAAVDHQRTRSNVLQKAVIAQVKALDMLAGGQHADNDIATAPPGPPTQPPWHRSRARASVPATDQHGHFVARQSVQRRGPP